MRPLSRLTPETPDSWFTRIRENLGQLLIATPFQPSAANGAPIHLLKFEKSHRTRQAQTVSLAAHGLALAVITLLVIHPPGNDSGRVSPTTKSRGVISLPAEILRTLGPYGAQGGGRGGDQDPIPVTHGNPPHPSSIQLIKPSLPQNRNTELPVPPSILDANAPSILIVVDKAGLPWMREDTNSPGPGKGHTIGSAEGNTMGDFGNGPVGYGEAGIYSGLGGTMPSCAYCPLPVYTDEARQVKMQGTVTLRVLVGTDGRAIDIRVLRGIGYGLEERAAQTVRGWKFNPARDAEHRPAAAWVTIETVFRLF